MLFPTSVMYIDKNSNAKVSSQEAFDEDVLKYVLKNVSCKKNYLPTPGVDVDVDIVVENNADTAAFEIGK